MLQPIERQQDEQFSDFEEEALLFKMFGDPVRLKIIHLLLQQPGLLSVDDLTERIGKLQQATISHHLRLLYHAGILHREKDGQHTYYAVKRSSLEKMQHVLSQIGSYDF